MYNPNISHTTHNSLIKLTHHHTHRHRHNRQSTVLLLLLLGVAELQSINHEHHQKCPNIRQGNAGDALGKRIERSLTALASLLLFVYVICGVVIVAYLNVIIAIVVQIEHAI